MFESLRTDECGVAVVSKPQRESRKPLDYRTPLENLWIVGVYRKQVVLFSGFVPIDFQPAPSFPFLGVATALQPPNEFP
jgi:hypothetical protein